MVFSSPSFLFYFLPLVLALYYVLPVRARNGMLTAASYVFYGWIHPWLVVLMLSSTFIDWQCGRWISAPGASPAKRKRAVAVSVTANLSLLGFFKYGVFAQENVHRLVQLFGYDGFTVLQIVLPVGISFYTFQSMSYSIDVYRNQAAAARSFFDFACFVALFPQLVAGPIVRWQDLQAQLHARPQQGERFAEGVLHFSIGFAKKIVLANTLSQAVDIAFEAEHLGPFAAWFGLLAYTLQLYFDFSGYSDMAIGLGLMLGFRLPVNFRSPLKALGFTEIWQRWHITLSTWLRDYLYFSLGGNRGTPGRVAFNLWATMLVAGIWHGAQWQFLFFGIVQGTFLALERARGRRPLWHRAPRLIQLALMSFVWMLTLVFIRSDDLGHCGRMFQALFVGRGDEAATALVNGRLWTPYFLVALGVSLAIVHFGRETPWIVERALRRPLLAAGVLAVFAFSVVVMFTQAENPFIYFRF